MSSSGFEYTRSQEVERYFWLLIVCAVVGTLVYMAIIDAPKDPPTNFERAADEATGYNFALCLPINYEGDPNKTFTASILGDESGNPVLAQSPIFTATEAAGFTIFCAVIEEPALGYRIRYQLQFKEPLPDHPSIKVLFQPALCNELGARWNDLNLDHGNCNAKPHAVNVEADSIGMYTWTMVNARDADGPTIAIRSLKSGDSLRPGM